MWWHLVPYGTLEHKRVKMFPQARRWNIKAWNAKTWSLIQTVSTLIKCRAWHTCASSYTSKVNLGDTRWSTTVHKPNHGLRLTWSNFNTESWSLTAIEPDICGMNILLGFNFLMTVHIIESKVFCLTTKPISS